MSFQYHGRAFCWSGVPLTTTPRLRATTAASESLLDELLAAFGDVFAEPRGVPPQRARYHAIVLKPDAAPSLSGRTGTRRPTRTNWSGNAPP